MSYPSGSTMKSAVSTDSLTDGTSFRTGFWATHASGLFFVVLGELMSVMALLHLGPLLLKLGLAAIFYYGLGLFAIAAFAYLPVHWALRHRRMHRASH